MSAQPAISVRDVSKSFRIYRRRESTLKEVVVRRRRGVYEQFYALRDVSFDVDPGQSVGILGRNGAGKSTTLKLLARILTPDRGDIHTEGRLSALLELGAGFHPEYTAIENIYLSGAIYGLSRAQLRGKVDEIIDFAELEQFADNPVKTYSSGMYARLGFSIAVNVDPDVLLLDEVLAVGDRSFQTRCFDRMLRFKEDGKTLVLVTHDLGAVESFCDRAIWIDGGRIVADGEPRDVVKAYTKAVNQGDEQWSAERMRGRAGGVAEHRPLNLSVPIVLRALELRAGDEVERDVFHNGEELRIRIGYLAQQPVRSPICEVELHRHDGTHVTTASTLTGRLETGDVLEGTGWFEWAVGDLTLTPGTYYVTARLYDQTGQHVLDEHERWFRFRVQAGAYGESQGTVVLPAVWSHVREQDALPAPEAAPPAPTLSE